MDCQVCNKPYNTSSRQPKTLVCGHMYCTECLTKLQDATSSSIMCPKDRTMSTVPEGTRTDRTGREANQDGKQLIPVLDYTAVTFSHSYGKQGSGAEEFYQPLAVAISPVTGNIAISDHSNDRIHILTADLRPVRVFGSRGSGVNQFRSPAGVCFSSSGSLFIADQGNHRIQQVTEEGENIMAFGSEGTGAGQFKHPHGICWKRGLLYIGDWDNLRLQVMRESGEHVRTIGSKGSAPGQFADPPWYIAVSGQHDKLVVSDSAGNLHFFTIDGQHKKTIRAGQPPYNIEWASGITIDSLGQVIVCNFKRKCVVVLGEDKVISTIRLPPGEEIGDPQGVTVTQDGSIIVCDWQKHKIYKFTAGHH